MRCIKMYTLVIAILVFSNSCNQVNVEPLGYQDDTIILSESVFDISSDEKTITVTTEGLSWGINGVDVDSRYYYFTEEQWEKTDWDTFGYSIEGEGFTVTKTSLNTLSIELKDNITINQRVFTIELQHGNCFVSVTVNQAGRSETLGLIDGFYQASRTDTPITLDGIADETSWNNVTWSSMNYLWMGSVANYSDFSGNYKVLWDHNKIYVLVEIKDDIINSSENELQDYWMGDCIEIFIDEDKSGGAHHYSHNAFAYHISKATKNVYDLSTSGEVVIFDHVTTEIVQDGDIYRWEMAIDVYDDTYNETGSNTPLQLTSGKSLGFSIAYCDNDSGVRNAFIGSKSSHGVNNDEGYTNAGVLGTLELTE